MQCYAHSFLILLLNYYYYYIYYCYCYYYCIVLFNLSEYGFLATSFLVICCIYFLLSVYDSDCLYFCSLRLVYVVFLMRKCLIKNLFSSYYSYYWYALLLCPVLVRRSILGCFCTTIVTITHLLERNSLI